VEISSKGEKKVTGVTIKREEKKRFALILGSEENKASIDGNSEKS